MLPKSSKHMEGSFGIELALTRGPNDGVWIGANRFGPTRMHEGRVAMLRPDPLALQANSMHANPTMSSPDILVWPQQVFVNEGETFEYTIVLTHPPGSTDADGVFDLERDTVQIWLSSSQEILQEHRPGHFNELKGHRTQLVIETACVFDSEVPPCISDWLWTHSKWDGSTPNDYKTTKTGDKAGGEALIVFDSTNWYVPQTVKVTARQDNVFEPRQPSRPTSLRPPPGRHAGVQQPSLSRG